MTKPDFDRYAGQAIHRLVELWVLWAIGELSAVDELTLRSLEPELRKTWRREGEWHELIAAILNSPPKLPDDLRRMWQRNLAIAQERNEEPPKNYFARSIADQLVGPLE